MKYFYEKADKGQPLHGEKIELKHPAYKFGTLFKQGERGLIFVQKRFSCKYAYWDAIDYWLANDIFEHPRFQNYFEKYAGKDPPIIQVRSAMWELRMKPLPKEEWEEYF